MSVEQLLSAELLIAMAATFINLSSTVAKMMPMPLQVQIASKLFLTVVAVELGNDVYEVWMTCLQQFNN